jgi:hypothetical protein
MTTQTAGLAPDFNPGYPSKGRLLGPAWQLIWDKLHEGDPREWREGRPLCHEVAEAVGAQPATVIALISRAAYAELLERESRLVTVPIETKDAQGKVLAVRQGKRARTFYRVAPDA